MNFSVNDLIGPGAALVVMAIGLKSLWDFMTRHIDDKFKIMREEVLLVRDELKECHSQHAETKKELDVMRGKIEVLEKYSPSNMVQDILAGIEKYFRENK